MFLAQDSHHVNGPLSQHVGLCYKRGGRLCARGKRGQWSARSRRSRSRSPLRSSPEPTFDVDEPPFFQPPESEPEPEEDRLLKKEIE